MRIKANIKCIGISLSAVAIAVVSLLNANGAVNKVASGYDTDKAKIEAILGKEIGDVTEKDVKDVVTMVENVMKVANEPHTIPAGCPENIVNDIMENSDFNEKGKGIVGKVDKYETILYGNGQYVVRMQVNLNGHTYDINGNKVEGQVRLSSMADIVRVLRDLNTSGDYGIHVEPDNTPLYDDYVPPVDKFEVNESGERIYAPRREAGDIE